MNVTKVSMFLFVGVIVFFAGEILVLASVNSETNHAATKLGAKSVTEITFDSGSSSLSDGAKKDLEAMIKEGHKHGSIKQVKVLAWADQDYPPKGVNVAPDQIELAEKRAEGVQAYLEEQFKVPGVSTVNMAERPNAVQNILKTPGAKAKNALENSGAAPTRSDQTGFLGLKGKASHAVVMVIYK
jgi:hypothetical protein